MLTRLKSSGDHGGKESKSKNCKEFTVKEDLHLAKLRPGALQLPRTPCPHCAAEETEALVASTLCPTLRACQGREPAFEPWWCASKPSRAPPMPQWNNPHLSERVKKKKKQSLFYRQNDGCDDLSRSLPTSKFCSFDTNNCCHQVLWVGLRPVTNFPTKSGAEQETGLLKDHGRGSYFFPFLTVCGLFSFLYPSFLHVLHRNRKCLCTNY